MPYKISGTKNATSRVILLDESDWSVESNTVISGTGSYEINDVVSGTKTIISRTESGEVVSYGNVLASFYELPGYGFWGWGYNHYGQLGQGDSGAETTRSSPVQIGDQVDSASGGSSYTMFVKEDGTLWACGANNSGELGLGDRTPRSSPVQVGSDTNWSQVTTGTNYTHAIKSDGTLWAWGENGLWRGQLGLGDHDNDRSSPTQVGDLTNWSKVKNGYRHSMAIKTDGTLWAWGDDGNSQLGLGTNDVSRSSPVQVGTDTDWADIGPGEYHTLALKTNGELWAWGQDGHGQCALDGGGVKSNPQQVGSDTNWSKIQGSNYFSVTMKSDGTIWTFGINRYGSCGDGTTTWRHSPVQVGSDTYKDVSVCGESCIAIRSNGTIWGWGYNAAGQLLQGDTENRSSPVLIDSGTDWKMVISSWGYTPRVFK